MRMTEEELLLFQSKKVKIDPITISKGRISKVTQSVVTQTITERSFQHMVESLLKQFNWKFYHTYRSDRSPAGFPDIVAVRKERLIFAELKKENGRASEEQKEWLSSLIIACPETYLWKPSQIDEIVRVLQ